MGNRLNKTPKKLLISKNNFYEMHRFSSPRIICFLEQHSRSLKVNPAGTGGKLGLPFDDSFYPIFYATTSLEMYRSRTTNPLSIFRENNLEKENTACSEFISSFNEIIFIRDLLSISVSLSYNKRPKDGYPEELQDTALGLLYNKAKRHFCLESTRQIASLLENFIKSTPFYKNSSHICSVPSNSANNLPSRLVEIISSTLNLTNISKAIAWSASDQLIRSTPFIDKWDVLEKRNLNIKAEFVPTKEHEEERSVILIDDLYQSGITTNFIAEKLSLLGYDYVYGLSVVKSRSNDENTGTTPDD